MPNLVIIQPKDAKPLFTGLFPKYQLRYVQDNYRENIDHETEAIIVALLDKAVEYCVNLRQSGCLLPIICYGNSLTLTQVKFLQIAGKILYIEQGEETKVLSFLADRKLVLEDAQKAISICFAGTSDRIKQFQRTVFQNAGGNNPLFLFGEPGTGKRSIAKYFFEISPYNDREWIELNLNNYSAESHESHIWTALQSVYKKYSTELQGVELPIYSMLYIKGLEHKDILFLISLLEWLYEKRNDQESPFGSSIKVVVGLETPELKKDIPREFFDKYSMIAVPALRERREDLVTIVQIILKECCRRFGRSVDGLTTKLWDFLFSNQWYGNIEELRYNLETAFLLIPAEKKVIDLQDFFVFKEQLFEYAKNDTVYEAKEKIKQYCGE